MLPTTCLLALTLALTNPSATEEKRQTIEPNRAFQPTPRELEGFHLTSPPSSLVIGTDVPSQAFAATGAGMFVASAADLVTTELGLSRGLSEANPTAASRGARIASHVVGPAVVYWATTKLERHDRTKLAFALRLGLMAVYSYAAIHNARLMGSSP